MGVKEAKDDGIEVLDDVKQNGKAAEKEGGDSDEKAEDASENGKKKKKKKKTITDEEYFADVSSKEMKYLKKHLVSEKELDTQTIVCTACFKQVNYKQEGAVMRHADLAVPICKKCHKFYFKGEWTKDEEGFYEHCRWCANGGELMCCDSCPNAFCKKCIKRNLGRSKVSEIDDAAEWRCLACEPGQVAKLRALYYSIWTYNVKMAQTEEAKEKAKAQKDVAKDVAKESTKGREKSKFVDDAHKDGFEVTKILTNYLQKSQKGWKEKDATAQADQGDVTKLVVKFRTIIKVAHHNLDQLDRNLLEGCLSAYPEMTEDMLEAKTVPQEQNGHMKREGSDNEKKKVDKKPKKKPAKKVAVAAADAKEEDKEEKKKEQKELREKRKEERSGKKGTDAISEAEQDIEEVKEEADVKDETLEKDVSSKKTSKESKETKKNESDKKQGKKTKTEQESPSKMKEGKKSKEDKSDGGESDPDPKNI